MRFPRQEYWSGLPFPSPGNLPKPGVEHGSPTLQVDSLPSEPPGKPSWNQDCGRNINNLKFADDTTLMAESEEELKSLTKKVTEESEKAVLKFNIQETKIGASMSITS